MKTAHLLFAAWVLAILILSSCATETQHPLVGTWEMEAARYTSPDTTITVDMEEWSQIKVFTGSHYAWLGQASDREEFTVSGGTDEEFLAAARGFGAGGGTYTLEGDSTYTEHIDYSLNPGWVGAAIEFTYEMDGNDRWIQRGTLPMASLNMEEYDLELYEVWRRIE